MKHLSWSLVLLAAVLLLAAPVAGLAQSGDVSGQAQGQVQGQAQGITNAQGALDKAAPADQAIAEADAKAKAEARVKLDAVLERGAKEPAKSRADAEAKLQETAKQVDDGAAKEGDTKVAERLGGEFGMSADAVLAEKQTLGASWGELMIAHTLKANATTDLTVEQLVQMRKDGNGWGQIAAGMGFKLGEVVSAARAESRVAAGLAKADGKVQAIHGASASVHGASGLDVKAGGVGAGAKVGAGVDVKVKPGKP